MCMGKASWDAFTAGQLGYCQEGGVIIYHIEGGVIIYHIEWVVTIEKECGCHRQRTLFIHQIMSSKVAQLARATYIVCMAPSLKLAYMQSYDQEW